MVILSYTSLHTWFYKSADFEGIPIEKTHIDNNSYFTEKKLKEIDSYLKEESEPQV